MVAVSLASKNQMGSRAIPSAIASDAADDRTEQTLKYINLLRNEDNTAIEFSNSTVFTNYLDLIYQHAKNIFGSWYPEFGM